MTCRIIFTELEGPGLVITLKEQTKTRVILGEFCVANAPWPGGGGEEPSTNSWDDSLIWNDNENWRD